MTRADLKHIAREGSPDDTARVLSHSGKTDLPAKVPSRLPFVAIAIGPQVEKRLVHATLIG